MKAFTATGEVLMLEEPPLGRGGEGAIHRIAGHPDKVAKIYLDPSDAAQRQEKIEAMASISGLFDKTPVLGNIAWPLGALYADGGGTRFVGFGMRLVSAPFTIDTLYEYPPDPVAPLTMADKLAVVESLAELTDAAHRAGQVIGDYNDNNVPVLPSLQAGLVDADSFHAAVNGTTYRCAVCMPGYVAPEVLRAMRGCTSFDQCPHETFTARTDDWALAVHVFRTLFNGAHPYHCLPLPAANGSLPAVLPVDKRVERGETPFFTQVPGVKLPPFAPDARMLPPYMEALFQRAFVAGHADACARPSAKEWRQGIARYRSEVVPCSCNSAHHYHRRLASCPYCEADARASQALHASGLSSRPTPIQPAAAVAAAARTASAPLRTAAAAGASAAAGAPAPHAVAAPARGANAAAVKLPLRPAFASANFSRGGYLALSTLFGAGIATLCLASPLPALLYTLTLGSYEPWMQAMAVVSGIGGTCTFNRFWGTSDSIGRFLLAGLSAVAGMVAAAFALGLLQALVGAALSLLSGILMGAFLLILLIGLLNG